MPLKCSNYEHLSGTEQNEIVNVADAEEAKAKECFHTPKERQKGVHISCISVTLVVHDQLLHGIKLWSGGDVVAAIV